MIIGSVPLYNVMAVLVLSLFQPGRQGFSREMIKRTMKGIVTNPIMIGIVAGLLWSGLRLPLPQILNKALSSVGAVATPMGLMSMGASFGFGRALDKAGPVLTAAFIKLAGLCAVFLPAAVGMGFREEKLAAILVMLGSATTVSSYVMAKNMGHEGILSAGVVMVTTLFSAFTLTGWLYLLRSKGYI